MISQRPTILPVHFPPGIPAVIIEFAPHNLTDYSGLGYYVKYSSDYWDSGHAWRAFNGTALGANVSWLGINNGVDWLSIDVGSSYYLDHYTINVNTVPEPNRAPKNWILDGSNDGITWTILDTRTNQTSWSSGENRNFTVIGANAYSIFRISISANNGDSTYTQIGELYLYGSKYNSAESISINFGHALATNLAAVVPLYENAGLVAHDILNSTVSSNASGTIRWLENINQKISVAFNGASNGFQNFGNIANYNTQTFSFESLVYVATVGGPATIFSTGDNGGVQIRIYNQKLNLLKAAVADMGSSTTNLVAGNWYHLGITYNGTTVSFYINGVAAGTTSSTQTFINTNFHIGSKGTGIEFMGNGDKIAYVYLWKNRVLTAGDFATLNSNPYVFFN